MRPWRPRAVRRSTPPGITTSWPTRWSSCRTARCVRTCGPGWSPVPNGPRGGSAPSRRSRTTRRTRQRPSARSRSWCWSRSRHDDRPNDSDRNDDTAPAGDRLVAGTVTAQGDRCWRTDPLGLRLRRLFLVVLTLVLELVVQPVRGARSRAREIADDVGALKVFGPRAEGALGPPAAGSADR